MITVHQPVSSVPQQRNGQFGKGCKHCCMGTGGCMGSEWNNYCSADQRRVEKVALASTGTHLHAALNLVELFGTEIELQPF
jgi:hypothetical protein